jgi:hypothetical protein
VGRSTRKQVPPRVDQLFLPVESLFVSQPATTEECNRAHLAVKSSSGSGESRFSSQPTAGHRSPSEPVETAASSPSRILPNSSRTEGHDAALQPKLNIYVLRQLLVVLRGLRHVVNADGEPDSGRP